MEEKLLTYGVDLYRWSYHPRRIRNSNKVQHFGAKFNVILFLFSFSQISHDHMQIFDSLLLKKSILIAPNFFYGVK